jgi:hypothetical protein
MNINVTNVIAPLRDWCFTIGTKSFARTVSVKMSRNLCRPFPMRSLMPFVGNCPRVKDANTVWNAGTQVPGDRLLFSPGGGPSPHPLNDKCHEIRFYTHLICSTPRPRRKCFRLRSCSVRRRETAPFWRPLLPERGDPAE